MELADVAELTHVRKEYLVALEEGNYDALPEDVYSRNFLRLYGQAVGLSSDKLIDAYLSERRQTMGVAAPARSQEPRRREVQPRSDRPQRNFQIGAWLPTVLLVAAVVALAVWGFNTLLFNPGRTIDLTPVEPAQSAPQAGANTPPAASAPEPAAEPSDTPEAIAPILDEVLIDISTDPPGAQVSIDGFALPGFTPLQAMPVTPRDNRLVRVSLDGYEPFEQSYDLSDAVAISVTLTPIAEAEPPPADTPPPATGAPAAGDQISITITETTWLEVYQSSARNSGDRLVYTTVQPGERFVFELPVYVHVGNAAGVQISIGGQEIGALGSGGAVTGRAFGP
jgi:cytoskeletal protein RodZ